MLITDPKELERFYAHHRVWQGIPGIERTKGGRTFLTFYSGNTGEAFGNYCMLFKRDGDGDFGEPIAAVFKAGKYRCFDNVLWIDPLDRLWFIWNVEPGEQVMAAICEDPDADTLVFGEEFYIGCGVMMNKPTVLSTGEWLFPIALWMPHLNCEQRQGGVPKDIEPRSYVYKTTDNGKTFTKLGGADVNSRSYDEHMVLEKENGVLAMYVRTAYGIGISCSYDRGRSWSRGTATPLGGPCSRFHIRRLSSGRVLLINHINFTGRNNLTAMLSEDDGRSFPHRLLLDARDSVSYPDAKEGDDGFLYITYDRERGGSKHSLAEAERAAREILIARITEADILAGKLVTEDSYLAKVASKLGALCPSDPDPFHPQYEDGELAALLLANGDEDPVAAVFEHYPVDCTSDARVDAQKLDAAVDSFRASPDCKHLSELITLIRSGAVRRERSPIIEAVQKEIGKIFRTDFTVADLAARMKISVHYLTHLFKRFTGITVTEYRNELRLTEAKRMLVESDTSIGEIAQEVGFCTPAYFSEVFTASERISPSEYRRYHRR